MKRKYNFFQLKKDFPDKPYPDDVNEHVEKIVEASGYPKGQLVKSRLHKEFCKIHYGDDKDPLKTITVSMNRGIVDNIHMFQRINYDDGKYCIIEKPVRNESTTFKKEDPHV